MTHESFVASIVVVFALFIVNPSLLVSCAGGRDAVGSIGAYKYLIRQGITNNKKIYLYSPYFLWNDAINTNSSQLTSPLELRSVNSRLDVVLTVRPGRLQTDLYDFDTRMFCYEDQCNVPGPSIYCKPGDTLTIKLVNELSTSHGEATIGPLQGSTQYPNRTNIFIQGLRVDPSINSPYRYTSGDGDSIVYNYIIPADTMPGVHWYHSRVHGNAALQVMGGLFGALIIEPSLKQQYLIPASFSSIDRQLLVLSHVLLQPPTLSIPGVTKGGFSLLDEGFSNSSLSYTYLSQAFGSMLPINPAIHNNNINNRHYSSFTDAWFTNGDYQPTYTIQPGEWKILDVLVASSDRIVELELRDSVGFNAGNLACDVRLLAVDGIYLSTARTGDSTKHLTLVQSSRASIAVMCASVGTFFLQSATTFNSSNRLSSIGDYQTKSNQVLLILSVKGPKYVMSPPPIDLSFWRTASSSYLSNLLPDLNATDVTLTGSTSIASLSISTAQGGCCYSHSQQGEGIVGNYCMSNSSSSTTTTTTTTSFWLGMGKDCRPACYSDILCAALTSVATATAATSSSYSVAKFPTVMNGNCRYSSFTGYCSPPTTPSIAINYSSEYINSSSIPILSDPHDDLNVIEDTTHEVSIYGHSDYPYPIFIQGQVLQYSSFENIDASITNILSSGSYNPSPDIDANTYAVAGDWRELWPSLTGKSTLYTHFSSAFNGPVLVLSPFLKYEDLGLIRRILVEVDHGLLDSNNDGAVVSSDISISGDSSTTDISSSNDTGGSSDGSIGIYSMNNSSSPPRSALINSDSANRQYLCDTSGASWLYEESINITLNVRIITTSSCPNHFSVCQSTECGGDLKTRALINYQTIHVPLYPGISISSLHSPVDTTCENDIVGVSLNGVGIYGASDGVTSDCIHDESNDYSKAVYGRTSCAIPGKYDGLLHCGDAIRTYGQEFDKCGGYASARDGLYKYHVAPTCLLQQLSNNSIAGHSPQIGWAMDGFPIFGPIGPKGIIMRPCGSIAAHSQLCLDVCNGYFGLLPGYDNFTYRYYIIGDVGSGGCSSYINNLGACNRLESKCCLSAVPTTQSFPYTIGCLRGCKFGDTTCRLSDRKGTSIQYIPVESSHATSTFDDLYYHPIKDDVIIDTTLTIPKNSSRRNKIGITTTRPVNRRGVAQRNAFNDSINLFSFRSQHSNDTITTTSTSNNPSSLSSSSSPSSDPSSLSSLSSPSSDSYQSTEGVINTTSLSSTHDVYPVVEVVQPTANDAYFTGMAIDPLIPVVYYTTQRAIYSYNEETYDNTIIIAGILEVTIQGYNFGFSIEDIISLKVAGSTCTSIVHLSEYNIKCSLVLIDDLLSDQEVSSIYSTSQVELITIGGKVLGLSQQPLSLLMSGSGRPIVTSIDIQRMPFKPVAIAIAVHGGDSSGGGVVRTMYWSNYAYGAFNIQRCHLDGSRVETILFNVNDCDSSYLSCIIMRCLLYHHLHDISNDRNPTHL